MAAELLTPERLREIVHYDPLTGIFTWLVHRGRGHPGQPAGTPFKGYIRINTHGHKYFAHRLAWLYVHGVWPSDLIDHKNTVKTDNRIDNLRDTDNSTNILNMRRAVAGNKSGFLGVTTTTRGKFAATLELNGERHYFGVHDTPEAAHEAYLEGKRRLHRGFVERVDSAVTA
jgi:hypothetical protein